MGGRVIDAVVLHSGGIDSTTCLYHAVADFGAKNVMGLSVDYGQRHGKEIRRSKHICDRLGAAHHTAQITLPDSMLTDPNIGIPNVSYDEIDGVSPTYVPFRNGALLAQVTALAQALGAKAVYFGAHAEDAQNWAYPDCTPEFIGGMANAIYIGTYHQVRLHTPIQWMRKHEIIGQGQKLGVPFDLTWSCYAGGEHHCGECPTCLARAKGFIDAGVPDPTIYAVDILKSLKNRGM